LDIKNARSKVIWRAISPDSNVQHCKYEDLFWNGKRKNGNFFEVSAFSISVMLAI
jgi:hypothetical protein